MDGGTGSSDGGTSDGGGGNVSTNADGSQSVSITATNGLAGASDGSLGSGFSESFLSFLDANPDSADVLSYSPEAVNESFSNENTEDTFFNRAKNLVFQQAKNQAFKALPTPVQQFTILGRRGAEAVNNFSQGKVGDGVVSLLRATPMARGVEGAVNSVKSLFNLFGVKGDGVSYSGPGANSNSGQFMNNLLPGLAGLYMGNRMLSGMKDQATTLGSMYGQDSPYAQAMRQRLDRRDAAAGRRSQYGPREVELQAALADRYSQNAPYVNGLNQQMLQGRMQQMMMLQKLLGGRNGLARLFDSGTGVNSWFDGGKGVNADIMDWGLSDPGSWSDWTGGGKGLEATPSDWGDFGG